MTDMPTHDRGAAESAARIGAQAALDGRNYDTADWQHGGYEAQDWDSGPNYVPMKHHDAPQRRTWLALVLVALTIALVVITVLGLWRSFDGRSTSIQTGSCITATTAGDQITTERVDCDDASRPSYTVVERIDGDATCEAPLSSLRFQEPGADSVRRTYCLMENLHQDHCYTDSANLQLQSVDCADERAKAKVALRADDAADASRCEAGTTAIVFDKAPRRTYCLVQP